MLTEAYTHLLGRFIGWADDILLIMEVFRLRKCLKQCRPEAQWCIKVKSSCVSREWAQELMICWHACWHWGAV